MIQLRNAICSFALLATAAGAGSAQQTYATKTQDIRAGILIVPSATNATVVAGTNQGGTAAPFAFFNLDRARSIKPAGWNIYNPGAGGVLSERARLRYKALNITKGLNNQNLAEGTLLNKRTQEYWSVYLDSVSDATLANYDVLLLAPTYRLELSPSEREKLRKFVDHGGILWVDPSGATNEFSNTATHVDATNSVPLAFAYTSTTNTNGVADYTNPILTTPNYISSTDLNYLNGFGGSVGKTLTGAMTFVSPFGSMDRALGPIFSEFGQYDLAAGFGSGGNLDFPTMAVGRVGDGMIVVTTRANAQMLNRVAYTTLNDNHGFFALDSELDDEGKAAAKLGVNIISLANTFRQPAGGANKTNSLNADAGAPVLRRFADEGATPNAETTPVIYKGVALVATGNVISAYDAEPNRDLDGDGDPDDGDVDLSTGNGYDRLWTSETMSGTISSPVIVPANISGTGVDEVLVTDSSSNVYVFPLLRKNSSNGKIIGGVYAHIAKITPPQSGQYEGTPQPPTVTGSLAFVADSTSTGANPAGRVWVIDLTTNTKLSSSGTNYFRVGNASSQPLPSPTAAPTIGFIPIQDRSGGVDRVVYFPGANGTTRVPAISSLWLGASGEKPDVAVNGSTLLLTTRAGSANSMPLYLPADTTSLSVAQKMLLPRISVILSATGRALAPGDPDYPIDGTTFQQPTNGVIQVGMTGGYTQESFAAKYGIRVDYTIDWGNNPDQYSSSIERGRLQMPTPSGVTASNESILGPVALTPQGTIVAVLTSSAGNSSGSLFWLKEDQGRGRFRVTGRFDLYGKYRFSTQGVTNQHGPVLVDTDPLVNFLSNGGMTGIANMLSQPLSGFKFAGGPSVRGGQVLVSVNAAKGGSVPCLILAAFKAEPELPQLNLGSFSGDPVIVQPDFLRSNDATQPEQVTTLDVNSKSFTYDSSSGVLRVDNLAKISGSQASQQIADCLNLSAPIAIGTSGGSYTYREPDANADRWTPLLWYTLSNGATATTSPIVAGSTAYLPCSSMLASAINTGNFGAKNAMLWAVDTDVSGTDAFISYPSDRAWLQQLDQLSFTASPFAVSANPKIRMPQFVGITSFDDFKIRVNQTALGTSATTVLGVAVGEGDVLVNTDKGFFGLNRGDFVICDQGRLLRVDGAGNALSSIDHLFYTGPGGGGRAANPLAVVEPTRAYALDDNQYLVVDSGANRVAKIDNTGLIHRALSSFIPDRDHKPASYTANEPLTLSNPRDALTYSNYVYKGTVEQVADQQSVEYWTHYLIADTGNHRLIELIDRFSVDSAGRIGPLIQVSMLDPAHIDSSATPVSLPQAAVLLWQSPLEVSGTGYDYNSISRVAMPDATNNWRYVYVAGIGNADPSNTATSASSTTIEKRNSPPAGQSGAGGVVIFDPAGMGVKVYNRYSRPNLTGTPFWDPVSGSFKTDSSLISRTNVGFSGVKAVTTRVVATGGTGRLAVMVTDTNGIYEFIVNPASGDDTSLGEPDWMINERAFQSILHPWGGAPSSANAFRFRPTYARRLDTGDIMLVNGYMGTTNSGYNGAVMLLDGGFSSNATSGQFGYGKENLGFGTNSIRFLLPSVTGARDLVGPTFADRR